VLSRRFRVPGQHSLLSALTGVGAGPAQVGLAAAGHSALGVAAGGYVRAWGWSLVRGRGWDALLGN